MTVGKRIFLKREMPDLDIMYQFKEIPASNTADVMNRVGSMHPRINLMSSPNEPIIVGPALTVKARAGDNLVIHKALNMAQEGDVIVVSNEGDNTRALVGEVMMAYAQYTKKVAGIIFDGPIRDIDAIQHMHMHIYATGTTPGGPYKEGPGEINVPIACGEVTVEPGDIVLCDPDGVTVIPKGEAAGVLEAAKKFKAEDEKKLAAAKNGTANRDWVGKSLVEKGFEGMNFDGWMGHYQVVSGFDDVQGVFIVQDSYKGPDLEVKYQDFEEQWRAFNYTYIVIYPADRREQVLQILGFQAFDNYNNRFAEQKARAETTALGGRALFFAWYNLGTNLVTLQDYAAAATAYDAAFAHYPDIPEAERPWRILWYQTGPYFAYYYTGRYQDVVDLATTTLDTMSEPVLEESYYWSARARLALGDRQGAIDDLRLSLEAHPDFGPAIEQLTLLGEQP